MPDISGAGEETGAVPTLSPVSLTALSLALRFEVTSFSWIQAHALRVWGSPGFIQDLF